MGMPGWAMVAGAPFAADKLIMDPISSAYGLYKGIRDDQADQNDKLAGMQEIEKFRKDPNSELDIFKFSDPKAAATVYDQVTKMRDAGYQKQAAHPLARFAQGYRNAVGTGDFTDPASMEVLRQEGVAVPTSADMLNPFVRKGVDELGQRGQAAADAADALGGNSSLGWLAAGPAAPNLSELLTSKDKDATRQAGADNIAQFARAQDVAASYLLPNQGSQNRGSYQSAAEVRADVASSLAPFALTDQQRNSINTMIDKGMEDVWVDGRNPYSGKADQEVLSARRAEDATRRQETAATASESRLLKSIEAADRRQSRSISAADARADKRDDMRRNRPLPSGALTAMASNLENLRRAETAFTLLEGGSVGGAEGDKKAIGWKGYIPDTILNRVDPAGTNTRASIADLGSLVIHDRSGAAVTASEHPRLKPFIPLDTDDVVTAKKKLKLFVNNYRAENESLRSIYREAGYKLEDKAPATQPPKSGKVGKYTYEVN